MITALSYWRRWKARRYDETSRDKSKNSTKADNSPEVYRKMILKGNFLNQVRFLIFTDSFLELFGHNLYIHR